MTLSKTMDGVEQSKMEQGIRRTWTNKYVSIAMVMYKDARVREAGGRRPRDYEDSKFPSFLTKF